VVELAQNFPQAHDWLGRCYEAKRNYPLAIEKYKTRDLQNGFDPALLKRAGLVK
jgi:hypothetical protein